MDDQSEQDLTIEKLNQVLKYLEFLISNYHKLTKDMLADLPIDAKIQLIHNCDDLRKSLLESKENCEYYLNEAITKKGIDQRLN